jgi:hypothetical protein
MQTEKLIPNIDRRLSSWIAIQGRLKSEPPSQQKPTITISRKFGSEAFPLAEILKDLLEKKSGDTWTIFDKALIEKVSQETALSERLLTSLSSASKALDALATMIPGLATTSDVYKVLARYVIRIALDGNAIIIGRGGAILTQHLPNCFHFRLEAPLEFRVRSIQKRLDITNEEAKTLVLEKEKSSDRFIEGFLNSSVEDRRFYHAMYDSSKSQLSRIARSIQCLVFEE